MDEDFQILLPETAGPYREAIAQGRLVLPRCGDCGRVHFYPRMICPHCHGADLRWTELPPEGEAYAVTTYRRSPTPHALAYLAHAEGVLILTRIIGETPNIGDRLTLVASSSSTPCARVKRQIEVS